MPFARHLFPLLGLGGIALLSTCTDPVQPASGARFILTSVRGVPVPAPWPPGVGSDRDFPVVFARAITFQSDTSFWLFEMNAYAHIPDTGAVIYTESSCRTGLEFFHRSGDTIVLNPTSSDYNILAHDVLVDHGFVIDQLEPMPALDTLVDFRYEGGSGGPTDCS